MELASMLAGERFTDHPRSVCPTVGALLRAYNDALGDGERQDLFNFAADAVGTRHGYDLEEQWARFASPGHGAGNIAAAASASPGASRGSRPTHHR